MKLRLSTLRWPLTAATAGVAVLWVGSMFAEARWIGGPWLAYLHGGSAVFMHVESLTRGLTPPLNARWTEWVAWSNVRAWPGWSLQDRKQAWVEVPLWMPLVVTGVFTARAWRSHRASTTPADRARTGACPRCGYAREGLDPAAPCPECALVPPPPSPPAAPHVPPPAPS